MTRQKFMHGFRCFDEIGMDWQQAVYEVVRMMLKAATRRGEVMRRPLAKRKPTPKPKTVARRISDRERAKAYRKRHPSRHHDAVQRSRVKARRLGKEVGEMVAAVLIRNAPRPSPGSRLRSHTNDRQDLEAKNAPVSLAGQS